MTIDFSKFVDLAYLLDPNPPYQFAGFWLLLALFGVALLAAIVLPFYPWQSWQESLKQRLSTPLYVSSLGGFLLLFARNQSIPYLSSRFLLLALILASLAWIGYSLRVARKKSSAAKVASEHAATFQKYLPKPSLTRPKKKR